MKRYDEDLAFLLRYENIAWYEDGQVRILDRRVYPTEINFVSCDSHQEVAQAIADMVTQSAGPYTAAGMGMALAAYECKYMNQQNMKTYLEKAAYTLSHARPTTVSRMKQVTNACLDAAAITMAAGREVDAAIFEHTVNSLNRRYSTMEKVGKYLVDMFPDKANVMTQCFGETIVGMMLRVAKERKKEVRLFVPETRPYFQGSRLTASVAYDQGFDTTVITDNMPAFTMLTKEIDLFTSAADVICLDGHVVNKIGTYQIAIAAKYHGIPYFVTGLPDAAHPGIDTVKIEERDSKLVLEA
ncbi:MAG: s-methyl-5-thioribose-1-phosphate isomerase, partial [Fastidiosipila sp.]|nr:s-methyl-5-thioribose-1-phosphate isomerase [Fastidiosipila sp.]